MPAISTRLVSIAMEDLTHVTAYGWCLDLTTKGTDIRETEIICDNYKEVWTRHDDDSNLSGDRRHKARRMPRSDMAKEFRASWQHGARVSGLRWLSIACPVTVGSILKGHPNLILARRG